MVDKFSLNFPDLIEIIVVITKWKQLLAFRHQLDKLCHEILEVSVIAVVVNHALNYPSIVYLGIKEAPENAGVYGKCICKEDNSIGILNIGIHVLKDKNVIVYKFKDLHSFLQIRDETDLFPLAQDLDSASTMHRGLFEELTGNYTDILCIDALSCFKSVDIKTCHLIFLFYFIQFIIW